MTLYKNQYRIESVRKKGWDYSSNGEYFCTICTRKHKNYFGRIVDEMMVLNDVGKIAHDYLLEIPLKYPAISIDIEQLMPNHLHAILKIDNSKLYTSSITNLTLEDISEFDKIFRRVPRKLKTLQIKNQPGGCTGMFNPMLYENLSTALRAYKAKCTTEIRKLNPAFGWHPKFYDHFIVDKEEYKRIFYYIKNNPKNWKDDKYFMI